MANVLRRLDVNSYSRWRAGLLYLLLLVPSDLAAFTSQPRWGQSVALLNDRLFVHGGKTDQFNAYSYTGAPTTNDLFVLNLSANCDPASPSWTYISGSQDTSTPQGPTLAWHTISAYNSSHLLLFGGDGGPNSPIVLPNNNDSAVLLDIDNLASPNWTTEPEHWADQPARRIHHSSATSAGKVYLIGGEKDDGSGLGYSDHYVLDSIQSTFIQLPADNGPPDIFGHTSVLLLDGRVLVFGGYSQSSNGLLPLTTIWSLDTRTSPPSWSSVEVSDASVPPARRAFASTWVEGDNVLIHGGADAELQASMSDGWILNTSASPMTWTNITALSNLGPRRDHFAVQVGSQVVFGFGYAQNSGASVSLSVFDLDQNAFVNSFTPQSSPSQTSLAPPTGTNDPVSPGGSSGPGITHGGGDPQQTSGSSTPGSNGSTESGRKKDNAVAITLGSVIGILALVAAIVIVVIFVRHRRQSEQQFRLITDEETDSPTSDFRPGPLGSGRTATWLGLGGRRERYQTGHQEQGRGFFNLRRKAQSNRRRIDMLAHEDSSGFFDRTYRRAGSGSSKSWYSIRSTSHGRFASDGSWHAFGQMLSDSLHSLRSVGMAVGMTMGIRRVTTDSSVQSRLNREKPNDELPLDPFGDNEGQEVLFQYNATERDPSGNALTELPLARGLKDDARKIRASLTYSDPFKDQDVPQILPDIPSKSSGQVQSEEHHSHYLDDAASRSTLSHSSQAPPLVNISSRSSSDVVLSPFANVSSASSKSHDAMSALSTSPSQRPRTLSIINVATSPVQPVKRSDSWWGRIKRASLRESVYEHTRQPSMKADFDFRDPNPPPGRLGAIHEMSGSGNSDLAGLPETIAMSNDTNPSTVESKQSKGSRAGIYSTLGRHDRSTTSLNTSRTADSETLERFGGRMDVAQREATGTSIDYAPSFTTHNEGTGTFSSLGERASRRPSEAERSQDIAESGLLPDPDESRALVDSPTESSKAFTFPQQTDPPLPSSSPVTKSDPENSAEIRKSSVAGPNAGARSKRPLSGGAVAARVAEYERRLTLETGNLISPTTPKSNDIDAGAREPTSRKKNTVMKYGLVQRPELFIANPDHRHSTSSNS